MYREKISYNIEDMRLSNKVLFYIVNERPDGVTAMEISEIFNIFLSSAHHVLKRMVVQGYLRREITEEMNNNHKPKILYFATKKAKKRVNYLMGKQFDDWVPIPL